jgi:hypothetical protein
MHSGRDLLIEDDDATVAAAVLGLSAFSGVEGASAAAAVLRLSAFSDVDGAGR